MGAENEILVLINESKLESLFPKILDFLCPVYVARVAHIRLRRVLESKPPEPRLPVAVIAINNVKSTLPPSELIYTM